MSGFAVKEIVVHTPGPTPLLLHTAARTGLVLERVADMAGNLTTKDYWDSTYEARRALEPVELEGARNRCLRRIMHVKRPYIEAARSVLEIGGGGSAWLAYLALQYPHKRFASIDYSERGNQALSQFAEHRAVDNLEVYADDFFNAARYEQRFDFVYSHGVVEHFTDVAAALRAHATFLAPSGAMLVIIPNMAGILGPMTRWLNRPVYDVHVPHDLHSLSRGHEEAGLDVLDGGYLCSSHFGVLSSCVTRHSGWKWHVYRWLSRASKLSWWLEDRVVALPETKWVAPYIYVLSTNRSP